MMPHSSFFQVTSTGVATIGDKPKKISRTQSRSIRETRMLTICSQIPTTCNAGICLRRKFTSVSLLPASARQLCCFERRPPFSIGTGNSTELRDVLAKNPDMDFGGAQTPARVFLALIDGDFAEAERVLAASPREDFQDIDYSFYYPKAWFEAMIARAKGDSARATAAFSAARTILEQRLAVKPEDARTLAVLAQVDADLGHKELAIQEAKHAVDLMPVSKDIYDGALVLEGLAQVYTWTNEPDRAIELLQKLVTMPGYTNYARLKLYPMWTPLRGDPRFEKIVNSLAPKDQTK